MSVHQLVFTRRELEAIAMALRGDLSRGVYERNLYRHRKQKELEEVVDHEINAIMGALSIVENSLGPPTRLAKDDSGKAEQVTTSVRGPVGDGKPSPISYSDPSKCPNCHPDPRDPSHFCLKHRSKL